MQLPLPVLFLLIRGSSNPSYSSRDVSGNASIYYSSHELGVQLRINHIGSTEIHVEEWPITLPEGH